MVPRRAVLAAIAGACAASAAQAQQGPRAGTYRVVFVRLTTPFHLQNLVLEPGGRYAVYDVSDGALRSRGSYRLEQNGGFVRWLDGLFHEMGYGGTVTVEDGGATHRIRLTQRAYAINGR